MYSQSEVNQHAKKVINMTPKLQKSVIWELQEMANGSGLNGARKQFYKDKPNAYFKAVLNTIAVAILKGEQNEKNKRQ